VRFSRRCAIQIDVYLYLYLYPSAAGPLRARESSPIRDRRSTTEPLTDGGAVVRFLVSFMVDARGGVMIGRRHSGLRVIIAPTATSEPTRVQCKLVNTTKLTCPPPMSEADALAARVIDLGQTRLKFDRLAQ